MEGLEPLVGSSRETTETVMALQQRIVGENGRLDLGELGGRGLPCLTEGSRRALEMRFIQVGGHPETLLLDPFDRSPVDRGGARLQRLVHAVTKTNTLNKDK